MGDIPITPHTDRVAQEILKELRAKGITDAALDEGFYPFRGADGKMPLTGKQNGIPEAQETYEFLIKNHRRFPELARRYHLSPFWALPLKGEQTAPIRAFEAKIKMLVDKIDAEIDKLGPALKPVEKNKLKYAALCEGLGIPPAKKGNLQALKEAGLKNLVRWLQNEKPFVGGDKDCLPVASYQELIEQNCADSLLFGYSRLLQALEIAGFQVTPALIPPSFTSKANLSFIVRDLAGNLVFPQNDKELIDSFIPSPRLLQGVWFSGQAEVLKEIDPKMNRSLMEQTHRLIPELSAAHLFYGIALFNNGSGGDVSTARSEFEESHRLDPQDTSTCFYLGLTWAKEGNLEKAIGYYRQSLVDQTPPDVRAQAHFHFGLALAQRDQMKEAVEQLEKALSLNPKDKEALYLLGKIFQGQGNSAKALVYLEKLKKMDSGYRDSLFRLGWIYFEKGELEKAKFFWEESLKLKPNDFMAHEGLMALYVRRKEIDAALKIVEAVLKSAPTDQQFLQYRILFFLEKKEWGVVESELKNIGQRVGESAWLEEQWGAYFMAREDGKNAAVHFRKALQLDSGQWSHRFFLSVSLAMAEQFQESLKNISVVEPATLPPAVRDEYHKLMGSLFAGLKRWDEAVASFQKMLEANPASEEAPTLLASVFFQARRFEEAEKWAREGKKRFPHVVKNFLILGSIYYEQKKKEERVKIFEEALQREPKNSLVALNLALAYVDVEKAESAEKVAKKIIKESKESEAKAYAYGILGQVYQLRNKPDAALLNYEEAIKRDVAYFTFYDRARFLYSEHRAYGDAERVIRKWLALEPDSAAGHFILGDILYRQKLYVEALVSLRRASELDSANADIVSDMGVQHFALGAYPIALSFFQKAVKMNPKQANAQHNIGRALTEMGRMEEAVTAYQKALVLNPDSEITVRYLGETYGRMGKEAEAERIFSDYARRHPQKPQAHLSLFEVFMGRGNLVAAVKELEILRSFDATSPSVSYCEMVFAYSTGEYARAEEIGQRLLKRSPHSLNVRPMLAWLHLGRGDTNAAHDLLVDELGRDPYNIVALNTLGVLYLVAEQWLEAKAIFLKVLKVAPGFRPAQANLELAEQKSKKDPAVDFSSKYGVDPDSLYKPIPPLNRPPDIRKKDNGVDVYRPGEGFFPDLRKLFRRKNP